MLPSRCSQYSFAIGYFMRLECYLWSLMSVRYCEGVSTRLSRSAGFILPMRYTFQTGSKWSFRKVFFYHLSGLSFPLFFLLFFTIFSHRSLFKHILSLANCFLDYQYHMHMPLNSIHPLNVAVSDTGGEPRLAPMRGRGG